MRIGTKKVRGWNVYISSKNKDKTDFINSIILYSIIAFVTDVIITAMMVQNKWPVYWSGVPILFLFVIICFTIRSYRNLPIVTIETNENGIVIVKSNGTKNSYEWHEIDRIELQQKRSIDASVRDPTHMDVIRIIRRGVLERYSDSGTADIVPDLGIPARQLAGILQRELISHRNQ